MVSKNTTPCVLSTHCISNMYVKIMMPTLYTKLLLQKEMKIKLIKASFKSQKRKIFNNLGDNLMSLFLNFCLLNC